MKKVLYVDGCVHRDTSRTERLAQAYLKKLLSSEKDAELETVVLEDAALVPLDGAALENRERMIAAGDFSGDYFRFARSFAAADMLVIAVPYWDLSFPSVFKMYIERLCIRELTFRYTEQGIPVGLTGIRKAVYITTAGGYIGKMNFGFDYVEGVLKNLFSISRVQFICAEGLDIQGSDPQSILDRAIRSLPE